MDPTSPLQLLGLAGFAAYMGAYAALQFGFWRGDGFAYTAANLLAALLVLASLNEAFNLPSALIQCAWVLLSLLGLVRIGRRRAERAGAVRTAVVAWRENDSCIRAFHDRATPRPEWRFGPGSPISGP